MLKLSKARSVAIASLAGIGFSLGASVPSAQAGIDGYCWFVSRTPGQDCIGDRHTLKSNNAMMAYYQGWTGAAALNTSYHYYGSWVYGSGAACHPYRAGVLLYPLTLNASNTTRTMAGQSYYGVDQKC